MKYQETVNSYWKAMQRVKNALFLAKRSFNDFQKETQRKDEIVVFLIEKSVYSAAPNGGSAGAAFS